MSIWSFEEALYKKFLFLLEVLEQKRLHGVDDYRPLTVWRRYIKVSLCLADIRMKEVLLHDDNMVRTNHLIVGIDNKCDHMQQPQQQDQQHPPSSVALIKPQCGRAMSHTSSGTIQFRDPKSAPLQKLSIDLISTYKRINQVCSLVSMISMISESKRIIQCVLAYTPPDQGCQVAVLKIPHTGSASVGGTKYWAIDSCIVWCYHNFNTGQRAKISDIPVKYPTPDNPTPDYAPFCLTLIRVMTKNKCLDKETT